MTRISPMIPLAALAALVVVAASSLFIVEQPEQAIVVRLGAYRTTITSPGLHVKAPFIDTVVFYDKRLLGMESPDEQIILGDQKRVVVDTYTRYRITDPLRFFQSVRTDSNARSQLTQIVQSEMRRVMGTVMLPSILSEERDRIMQQILQDVREQAKPYGVSVADVRIRRADLPEETSQAIYDRMKSERERQAKELRAQGYEWGQQIRARADRERTVILAEAQRQAQGLRGEGDATASQAYAAAFNQDPKFFALYRSLEAYRAALGDGTTMVLSPDSEFFRYFSGGPEGEAKRH